MGVGYDEEGVSAGYLAASRRRGTRLAAQEDSRATEQVSGKLRRRAAGPEASAVILVLPASILVGIVVVPLLALIIHALADGDVLGRLSSPLVRQALRVTAASTSLSLLIVLLTGTPLAYALARKSFPGRELVELAVNLPLVLPPVVAGVALLLAFGRRGAVGSQLATLGVELPFTLAAVVLAQVFVAGPFYVRGAAVGFAAISSAVEEAAAIDGASAWANFRYVAVPIAGPGIASGIVLCLGRALSEFGATLLFAGSFTGRTQTMSLAIVQAMETDLPAAIALAVLLVGAATLLLAIANAVERCRSAVRLANHDALAATSLGMILGTWRGPRR